MEASTSSVFKNILVPTDFGESSARALTIAVDLATRYGSSLTLLHTYEVPVYAYPGVVGVPADLATPLREAAQSQLDRNLAELQKRVPNAASILCFGVPWREIAATAERIHADLIVMGTHGRQGFNRMLLGSVAEKLVRTSPVPVLTVH